MKTESHILALLLLVALTTYVRCDDDENDNEALSNGYYGYKYVHYGYYGCQYPYKTPCCEVGETLYKRYEKYDLGYGKYSSPRETCEYVCDDYCKNEAYDGHACIYYVKNKNSYGRYKSSYSMKTGY